MTRGTYVIQSFVADKDVRDGAAGRFTPVERSPMYYGAWCVDSGDHVSAFALRFWYGRVEPTYWKLCKLAWRAGLLEPVEAERFSWKRHFAPFPWRGLRRERSRA
jgi:hypothetical protein